MKRVLPLAVLSAMSTLPSTPSWAHEPLWGETPIVFGSGLIHPETRVSVMSAGNAKDGGEASRMVEQETMIQYAPNPKMNLRLEVPHRWNRREQLIDGSVRSTLINGLGDVTVAVKSRFKARQEEELSVQHTLIAGLKLPTGRDDHRDPDGERASPHDQTGTGNLGFVLGYAVDRETLNDTIWANIEWRRDLGGGFRMGDMINANIAYGRWLKRANEAEQLGINLAVGLYGEMHRDDFLGNGKRDDNGHTLVGLHITPIFTKGASQFRIGALVPIYKRGPEDHVDFPVEFRAAFETFF